MARFVAAVSLALLAISSAIAQNPSASDPQAVRLAAQSLAAMTGGVAVNDVTLTGAVTRIAGSDNETGAAVFKARASGAGRMDLTFSSGQRSEVCDLSVSTPAGSWSGPDRISHAIAFHNLLTEPAWFFPAFAIARRLSTAGSVATYIGHETHNGQAVEHVSIWQTPSAQFSAGAPTVQHLTQLDFFLDSTNLLPLAISFNVHPDSDAGLDLPIEVRFSDYRAVNGAQVPFHVEKYLNNSLILDFHAESVTFNTGLTVSAISL